MLSENLTRKLSGIALVAVFLALPSVVLASLAKLNSRKKAPDFALRDSRGASVKLSDYKGKVVLLDFWATWCGGCKTEIPWYMGFEKKYRKSGLTVIGVAMDNGWKTVRPFIAEHKMNYPVVVASDTVTKLYGVYQLPMTLLIDRDGSVADRHVGVVNKDTFESEIQTLLHENGRTAAN